MAEQEAARSFKLGKEKKISPTLTIVKKFLKKTKKIDVIDGYQFVLQHKSSTIFVFCFFLKDKTESYGGVHLPAAKLSICFKGQRFGFKELKIKNQKDDKIIVLVVKTITKSLISFKEGEIG